MFLKIFCGDEIIIYRDIDKTFFRVRSEDGLMYLQFDISPRHPQYKCFELYVKIEYDDQFYVVTSINERKNISTIRCDLDLDGLNSYAFRSFIWRNVTFAEAASEALENSGWSISGAEIIKKKSTTELEYCSPLEILNYFQNTTSYAARYRFETKTKTIHIIQPYDKTVPSGVYFTDQFNMIEMVYKGNTANIVTRLMPIGKNDLDIMSVNNGSLYVENHSFTNRDVAAVWRDERYTDPESLLADAKNKLDELAKPEQSYSIKILDLAKINPEQYGSILSYDLFDIVTIVDRSRRKRLDHRVVEVKEYPAAPENNSVILSSKPIKIKTYRKKN